MVVLSRWTGSSCPSTPGLRTARKHGSCVRALHHELARWQALQPRPCGAFSYWICSRLRQQRTRRVAVKVKAAEADKDTCAVVFKLKRHCAFGEHMMIVGKGFRLGEWTVAAAPSMKWSEGDNWMLVLDLPPGTYQFKCVVHNEKTGESTWEVGENRVVHIAEGQRTLEVCCLYGDTSQTDVAPLNVAYAETAFAAAAPARAPAVVVEPPYVQASYEVGGYEGLTTSFASTDSLLISGDQPRSRGNAWDDVLEGVYDEPYSAAGSNGHVNGNGNGHNGHENGNGKNGNGTGAGHEQAYDEVVLASTQGTSLYNSNGAARGSMDEEGPYSAPPDNARSIWEQYKSSRGLSSLGSGSSSSSWNSADVSGASGSFGGSHGGSYDNDDDSAKGVGSLSRKGGKFMSRNNSANAAAWLGGSKLDQLQEQKIRDLQAELRRTENIRARLKEELSKVVVQSIESQKEVSKLQSEVQSLLTQRNSTLLQLSSMQTAVKESSKEVNRLKAQLEDTEHHLRSQSNQLNSKIAGLESDKSQMVQEVARLKSALDDKEQELIGQTTALRETIWNLEDDKQTLINETSELVGRLEELEGDLRKQNTALQQQIQVLQAEKEQALGQVARLRSELAEKDSELKQQTKELRDTVLALEEGKTQAVADLTAMKQQMEERETKMREEREELQQQIDALEEDHQRTLNEVARLEHQMEEREVGLEQQTQQLQQAIKALEEEKLRTAEEVGQLAEHLSRKEQEAKAHSLQLAQQIQVLHAERQEALDEIDKLHAAIEHVQFEKERSISEVDQLRVALHQQESRAAGKQTQLEELNQKLRNEVEQLRGGRPVESVASSWNTASAERNDFSWSNSSSNQGLGSSGDDFVHPWVRDHMPQLTPTAAGTAASGSNLWGVTASKSRSSGGGDSGGYRRSRGDRPRQRDSGRTDPHEDAKQSWSSPSSPSWARAADSESSSTVADLENRSSWMQGRGDGANDWTHPYFRQNEGETASAETSFSAVSNEKTNDWTHPWVQQREESADLQADTSGNLSSRAAAGPRANPSYDARRQGASRGRGGGSSMQSTKQSAWNSSSTDMKRTDDSYGNMSRVQEAKRADEAPRASGGRPPRPSSRPPRYSKPLQPSSADSWSNNLWGRESNAAKEPDAFVQHQAEPFGSSFSAGSGRDQWIHPYIAQQQSSTQTQGSQSDNVWGASATHTAQESKESEWTHPWIKENASQLSTLSNSAGEVETRTNSWDDQERVHPWFRQHHMSSIDEVSKAVLLEVEALSGENAMLEREINRIRKHIHELSSHKEGAKMQVQRLLAALREKEHKLKLR